MKTAIVIGAGPAGLTAAHELVAKGEGAWRILVLEESSALGGISRTVVHGDCRIDIGGRGPDAVFDVEEQAVRILGQTGGGRMRCVSLHAGHDHLLALPHARPVGGDGNHRLPVVLFPSCHRLCRLALVGATLSFVTAIYAKPICIPLSGALILALTLILKDVWWKKATMMLACGLAIAACLHLWTVRNRHAFGTAGLTTISGTNFYACNWGRLVEQLPSAEKAKEQESMKRFETSIQADDLMVQSQKRGHMRKSASSPICPSTGFSRSSAIRASMVARAWLPCSGISALNGSAIALMSCGGSDLSRGNAVHEDCPYTSEEKAIGASVQIVSWLILAGGYGLVLMGLWNGFRFVGACREDRFFNGLVCLCPILCLVLLALVIGPITSTRYRFIMIPFFAMIAARARQSAKPLRLRTG